MQGAELQKRFGVRVAKIVLAVSEDKSIDGYQTRKAALRQQVAGAGPEALTVFAADEISKARELRRVAPATGRCSATRPARKSNEASQTDQLRALAWSCWRNSSPVRRSSGSCDRSSAG